jgi:hypothetical protein
MVHGRVQVGPETVGALYCIQPLPKFDKTILYYVLGYLTAANYALSKVRQGDKIGAE